MGSKDDKEQQWSALHVRNTFVDYFKDRGHTFGKVAFIRSVYMLIQMRLQYPLPQLYRFQILLSFSQMLA